MRAPREICTAPNPWVLLAILLVFVLLSDIFISAVVHAQTVTIPPQTVTVTIPAQTVTITLPAQSVAVAPAPVITPPPVVTPPPAAGTAWIYHNGAYLWAGDWSGSIATINYADTIGAPGGKDISIKANAPWSYWLPYPPSIAATGQPSLDTTPYSAVTFQIKPTVAGQRWSMGAYKYTVSSTGVFTSDIPTGPGVGDISTYCAPILVPGMWSTCKIPLTALQASKLATFYKFIIQDQSGKTGDVYYLNEMGLTP